MNSRVDSCQGKLALAARESFTKSSAITLTCIKAMNLVGTLVFLFRAILSRSLDGLIHLLVFATGKNSMDYNKELIEGIWRPQSEEFVLDEASVTGKIPSDLVGMFVTIGPNSLHAPTGGFHVFDGDGAIRAVRFRGSKASFSFTHLRTEKYLAEKRLGYSRTVSLGALCDRSGLLIHVLSKIRHSVQNDQFDRSAANTNVEMHGGKIFALWEAGVPYRLAVLENEAALQCDGKMEIDYQGAFSAHPVVHKETERLYSVSYTPESTVHDAAIIVVDKNCKLIRKVPLHLGRKPMIHDAAITAKYVLVFDYPLLFEPQNIAKGQFAFSFFKNLKTRFGLFPVDAVHESEIQWFECDACMSFHSVCAWDEGSKVVLLLTRYSDINLDMKSMAVGNTGKGALYRYEFDTKKGTMAERSLPLDLSKYGIGREECSVDFPVINRDIEGHPVRYLYMTCVVNTPEQPISYTGVVKYDATEEKVAGYIDYGHDTDAIGEALFVPRGDAPKEDEGYIIAFVRDGKANISLHVYDSASMSNRTVVQVHAPEKFHIPNGFHSEFIPENLLIGE